MEKIGKGFIPMPYVMYKKLEEQVEMAKSYLKVLEDLKKEDDEWIQNVNLLESSGRALGLMDAEDEEKFKELRQHYVARLCMIDSAKKKVEEITKDFDKYYTMH